MSFFTELRRRNVPRVALVYLAATWLIIQVADVLFPVLQVPGWSLRLLVGLLALGFPVALILAWAFEITPDGIQRDEDQHSSVPTNSTKRKRLDYIIVGVLLAAVIFMLVDNYIWTSDSESTPATSTNAIAVLPMQLLNADSGDDYLADGMTMSLITELSKIQSLRVISLTSTQRYRDSDLPLPEIAKALNVGAIIEGTVLSSGDQVRINASLVPADSDSAVWSQAYDKDLGDVLAMHSEIAIAIAMQVQIALTDEDEARLVAPAAVDPEVQRLLLEGQHKLRVSEGADGLQLIEGATLLAPDYAPAWVALARAYLSYTNEDPQFLQRARAAANRAITLDDTGSDAHYVVGVIALYRDWDWKLAKESLHRALELNPGNEYALQVLGDYYEMIGQWPKSIELGIESTLSNPTSAMMRMNLGLTYNYSGQEQKGIETCEIGKSLPEPGQWLSICIAEAHALLGNEKEAVIAIEEAISGPNTEDAVYGLAAAYFGLVGQPDRAADIYRELSEDAHSRYVSPNFIGYAAFGAGDDDTFFAYINQAIDEKSTFTPWVANVPHFARLHGDPRFAAVVERLNLPEK